MKKSASGKKWLFRFFKISLVLLALYFLIKKVQTSEFQNLQLDLSWQRSSASLLLFSLLWIINISLDAWAWQKIQAIISQISLKSALLQNIKCYGLAFITPLNSGELVGRYIVQEDQAHRSKALFLTFWTHGPKLFGKTIVSLLILGLWLFTNKEQSYALLSWFLIIVATLLYLSLEKIISSFHSLKLYKFPLKNYLIKGEPGIQLKLQLLTIHSIRFLIFSSQLLVILYLIEPESLSLEIFYAVPLYYFLAAVTPTFAGLDFLIKGALSYYFFSFFSDDSLLFVMASTFVWLFNMAIPSLIGLASLNRKELSRIKRKRKKP